MAACGAESRKVSKWETLRLEITLRSLTKLHPGVLQTEMEARLRVALSDPAMPLTSALAQVCDEVRAEAGALRQTAAAGADAPRPTGSQKESQRTAVTAERVPRRLHDAEGASSSNQEQLRNGDGASSSNQEQQLRNDDLVGDHADSEVVEDPSSEMRAYYQWCEYFLSMEFPKICLTDLRQCLMANGWRIGPVYTSVLAEVSPTGTLGKEEAAEVADRRRWVPEGGLHLLKCGRKGYRKGAPRMRCNKFVRDCERMLLDSIARRNAAETGEQLRRDAELAMTLSRLEEVEAARRKEEDCTDIDCGCCYASYPIEQLVQCADGHLFCHDCLQRRVKELTFGGSNLHPEGQIPCMDTGGCSHLFPWAEVRRAVPADIFAKYEQRLGEHSVLKALAEGLFRCPSCDFPVELDKGVQELKCPNCHKWSCALCKQPAHFPLLCVKVEKKEATDFRLTVEEKMTLAVLRACTACKAELLKTEGCNKITCRCGHKMCYVCRASIKDYSHFCPHARDPGQKCNQCTRCSLWEQEDVDSVAAAARNQALREASHSDPDLVKRPIGWSAQDLAQAPLSAKRRRR
ncbi:hypothetical protein CBR_g72648 [Chara braunii]|uniref:RING-type domain-containing protein n=1 Tax=Chara braunii TaxID=69332 RepID=A0A388KAC0_CHABU|nr:hypothetical protein CBR_g72648 [Chara braunii]|eukprot:GBG66893.1 hypothetical protein CBR_g72648 [Chara braunii]